MNYSRNPLIRPRTPFEKRIVSEVEAAKPARSVGVCERPLPGGNSLTPLPARARGGNGNRTPFSILNGAVLPGLVGGVMPTLNGEPLDNTTEVLPATGDYLVFFTLNFTVTYTETYLSFYTLDTVTVNTAATIPADTDDTKHLQFNSVTNGVPVASYFDTSITITLYDDGPNSTAFFYS